MKKPIPILILIAAAIAAAGFYLKSGAAASGERRDGNGSPDVTVAETRDIEFNVTLSGDIAPASQLDVKSEVGGRVVKIYAEPGQEVKRGDPLVDIDDTELLTEKSSVATEIEGAQLQVDKTQRNFDRSKELFDAKLISREVFDNIASDLAIANNTIAKAERKLQTVEDKLRKTRIFAPADGTVLEVSVLEGQVVVPAASVNNGTTLMTIADLSSLIVDTHINQVDVTKVQVDQNVRLKGDTVKDADIEARISFIAPVASVKNNVKGFAVRAVISHPDPRLRPGMTVLMEVPVASAPEVVSVPISAVFRDGSTSVVYVMENGTPSKRPVDVGVSNLEYSEIRSGLKAGETILLVPPHDRSKKS